MSKNKIREGKPTTSFKKKDEKANFDVTEHRRGGVVKPKKVLFGDTHSTDVSVIRLRHNPMMSPELRNKLLRQFSE